jgi:hypothetical protein
MKKLVLTVCAVLAVAVAAPALAVVAGTDTYVPAVAHAPGAAGAAWRADAWIYNPSTTQSASVTVYLLLRQANPNPTSQVVTVNPTETRYFPDIIGTGLFQQTNAAGALRFVSSIPVVVTAESYNANVTTTKGTGTSGQFFGGTPADFAVGTDGTTSVIGLDQDATGTTGRWHSNLGLVETTGNSVNFVLDRLDDDGTVIGSWACDGTNAACPPLGGREVRQFDYVLQNFSPKTGANQRIRVRVTGGTGRIIAAGSRIDNITGDPSTIEMTGLYLTGRFEGVILPPSGNLESLLDGGLQATFGSGKLTFFGGVAGIPCGSSDLYTVDFSVPEGSNFSINSDGTFTAQTDAIDYSLDGVTTIFSTVWTLAGARQPDGSWSGTLSSNTSGGSGGYASCDGLVSRVWRAAWTGNS